MRKFPIVESLPIKEHRVKGCGAHMTAMTKTRKAIDALKEALAVFSASNRYGFLKALQIGRLVGDESALNSISDLTCECLVETGAIGVATRFRLTAAQVERLAELLTALGNGGVLGEQPIEQRPSAQPSPEPVYVNSVQAEQDLKQRLEELRAHPGFSKLRSITLGKFWDASWARAPFEEALTFGQLVDMDVALLFKKRSTSGSRAHTVTQAIEKALRTATAGTTPLANPAAPPPPALRQVPQVAPEPLEGHAWTSDGAADGLVELEPATLAMIERFVEAVSQPGAPAGSLREAMAPVASMLSRPEFLSLFGDAPLAPRVATQLSKWIRDIQAAPCVGLMREALQAPGCRLSFLARVVSDNGQYSAFSGMAATVLARALKAEQVRHEGVICRGVWSLNPGLISLVINEAKRRKPKDVAQTVKELCPALDPFLQSWVCEVVGPVTSRKAKRKGK